MNHIEKETSTMNHGIIRESIAVLTMIYIDGTSAAI